MYKRNLQHYLATLVLVLTSNCNAWKGANASAVSPTTSLPANCFTLISLQYLSCLNPPTASGTLLNESLYNYRISSSPRDWDGLKQDTYDFLYLELLGLAVLYFMPEGFSNWGDEEKERENLMGEKWWDNVQHMTWDDDDWYINYVLHPYWGATYYVRARHRGFNKNQSIAYSAALSALFEYGGEAIFERPSIQDLISTPLGGVLFGELLYDWRLTTLAKYSATEQIPMTDKLLLLLTDPLAAFYYKLDQFSESISLKVQPFYGAPQHHPLSHREYPSVDFNDKEPIFGITLKINI